MEEGNKYYSLKGKGKYFISEPDENGIVTAIDILQKPHVTIRVKKSLLRPWKKQKRVFSLRNRRY